MKQSLKVLLLLGAVVAANAAGPVTKRLGEVRSKNLAQTKQEAEVNTPVDVNDIGALNFFEIPEECTTTAQAEALADIAGCEHPDLAWCECDRDLPWVEHGEIARQALSYAAEVDTAIVSVPSVAASCQAIETCCACA